MSSLLYFIKQTYSVVRVHTLFQKNTIKLIQFNNYILITFSYRNENIGGVGYIFCYILAICTATAE